MIFRIPAAAAAAVVVVVVAAVVAVVAVAVLLVEEGVAGSVAGSTTAPLEQLEELALSR